MAKDDYTRTVCLGVGDASQPEMLIGRDTLYDNIRKAVSEGSRMEAPVINVYPSKGMNEERCLRALWTRRITVSLK